MNNYDELENYKKLVPAHKKNGVAFYIYLFILGVVIGVFLTNTFGPSSKLIPKANTLRPRP